MTFKISNPPLKTSDIELTPQQQRAKDIAQNIANLCNIESQLTNILKNKNIFAKYPEDIDIILKDELIKECYIQYGDHPKLGQIYDFYNANRQENIIEINVQSYFHVSISRDQLLKQYQLKNPEFDLEQLQRSLAEHARQAKVNNRLDNKRNILHNAFQVAYNARSQAVTERSRQIENATWFDKIRGKVPAPIPNVTEQSLSKEEVLKHVNPKFAESETLQMMLEKMLIHGEYTDSN